MRGTKNKVYIAWQLAESIFHYIFKQLNSNSEIDLYDSRENIHFSIVHKKSQVCSSQRFPFRLEKIRFLCISTAFMFEQFDIFKAMGKILCNPKFGYVTGKHKSWHGASFKVIKEKVSLLSKKYSMQCVIQPPFTTKDEVKLGRHSIVIRRLKGIFRGRPGLPRYLSTYDADIVIDVSQIVTNLK